jgi:hypothetical protein
MQNKVAYLWFDTFFGLQLDTEKVKILEDFNSHLADETEHRKKINE